MLEAGALPFARFGLLARAPTVFVIPFGKSEEVPFSFGEGDAARQGHGQGGWWFWRFLGVEAACVDVGRCIFFFSKWTKRNSGNGYAVRFCSVVVIAQVRENP